MQYGGGVCLSTTSTLGVGVLQILCERWPLSPRERGRGSTAGSLRDSHENHVCGDVALSVIKKARGKIPRRVRTWEPRGVMKLDYQSTTQSEPGSAVRV